MTHLLIPSIIAGISLLIFSALLFSTHPRMLSHPITNAIGNLVIYLYLALSGSLLIFAALPEYSFITHLTSTLPLMAMAGLLYTFVGVSLVYMDARENGMRVILTDILTLLCLAILPVLLVGAIPYQPWMAPVATLILIGDMVMTQTIYNKQKRPVPGASAA